MSTIPAETINEIQERCDIVELIASYIPLKKSGRNFKAPCPFHNEKTPSFLVSPDKQIYHCFGCGEGGNAISFLMKYERLDFKEAVETLAKRANVVIQFQEKDASKDSFITELYRINEIAADFYQSCLSKALNNNQHLRNYLESRNLKEETIKKFKIGLSPNQWDGLLNYLRAKSINIKLIEKAGLATAKEDGGFYDKFRNRLMIPILDVKNRIIAFGARALDDSMPKYINSPETPIYTKGKNLFALNLAKDAIKEKDFCVIVEGYFDVITPMQEGLLNIVASSGTALTTEQIRLLKRYTKNIIVIYDSDAAGQLATLRSLDLFLEEDIHVRIVNLPKGYDPDLYIKKIGIGKFNNLIDGSLDIFDYKLNILLGIYDIKKIQDKTKIALEMLATIKRIKNEIIKSEYVKLLAEKISVDEKILISELDKIKLGQTTYSSTSNSPSYNSTDIPKNMLYAYPKTEKMLIKLILEDIQITKDVKDRISPLDLQDKRMQKILEAAFELYNSYNKQLKPNQIINYINDESCINVISELASEETMASDAQNKGDILEDCIKRIRLNSIKLRRQNIQAQIKDSQSKGDTKDVDRLMREFNILMKKKE